MNEGPTESSGKRQRLFSLDVLRGIAISLVLMRHLMPDRHGANETIGPVVEYFRLIGWCGVDLFFVLSGFLIASLIFTEYRQQGRFHLGRFWLRRGFKIWPAYYVGFGLMAAAQVLRAVSTGNSAGGGQVLQDAIWNGLFLQNYVPCERWPHSWSLAIEEHFYLGLPLLLMLLWKINHRFEPTSGKRFRGLWIVACGLFCIALWMRCRACFPNLDWHTAYYRTHLRIDALFAGVVLGHLYVFHRPFIEEFRGWVPLALAAIVLCGVVPGIWPLTTNPLCASVGFTILWIGFGIIVLTAAKYPQAGSLGPKSITWPCRFLALLGVYSYTIYLGHSILFGIPGVARMLEILQDGLSAWGAPPLARLYVDRLYYLAGSVVLGLLLAYMVERPGLRMRSRWFPSRTEVAPT